MAVSATVTPGVVLSENEEVTISKLNALGTPTVDVSGAVGTLSLADGSVTNAKIATSAAIQHDKLAALSTGQLIVGNAGTPTATTVSGDATIAADGVVTIADNAITPAKMEDGTQGDVLVYGASGAPERLGTGTSGQVLTAGGAGATASWATPAVNSFVSAQGTPTTNSLSSESSDTKTGDITLTLPAGKTWVWVKVTFSTGLNTANCINQFNIKTGASGGTLSYESSWVGIGNPRETTNSESDNITVIYVKEGVPNVTDQSIDIETYSRLGSSFSTGDSQGFRRLYAVGIYQ